jgi:hypothetical protein
MLVSNVIDLNTIRAAKGQAPILQPMNRELPFALPSKNGLSQILMGEFPPEGDGVIRIEHKLGTHQEIELGHLEMHAMRLFLFGTRPICSTVGCLNYASTGLQTNLEGVEVLINLCPEHMHTVSCNGGDCIQEGPTNE